MSARSVAKRFLALGGGRQAAVGATLLTYHRVGGGSRDELDLPVDAFDAQLRLLDELGAEVLALTGALDRLRRGDPRPSLVLTFDDGFADVYVHAWPLLRERALPFTVYLAAGLVGSSMRWEGSAATSQGAPALSWAQLDEMVSSGLCTVANHTWDHATPRAVDENQLDLCSQAIEGRLGIRPEHFAWPWGVAVPELLPAVRERFRSAATGEIGRNPPGHDPYALRRVPVRRTDPLTFFEAKVRGGLLPERMYATLVDTAKAVRRAAQHG